MKKVIVIVFSMMFYLNSGFSQTTMLTVAEKSDFKSTSRYSDVMSFIGKLQKEYPDNLRLESIGTTSDGFDIPIMIMGKPLPDSPQDIDDRVVVYIQANIHAGEVEGKEAVQMLTRDILADTNNEIWDNVVMLFVPILNVDGNEKISTDNRRNQVGPKNGVGVRYNGQNLDLNRDAMKIETPEIRAVIENVLNKWDPAISVDCHTTNGSFHEEPVTFTWMQNPNGDRQLINFMRDDMMPTVRDSLRDKYNVENIYYGVFIDRMDYSKGWISYASEPRYLVNYIGLRNRLAILDENYVYADFRTRVEGSYGLLKTILEYASYNKDKIKDEIALADKRTIDSGSNDAVPDSFAIDYKVEPTPEPITIKAFETDTIPGVKGYWRYKQSDRKVTVTVPYLADYYSVYNVEVPYAYLIYPVNNEVIKNIRSHGIEVLFLDDSLNVDVLEFNFENISPSNRIDQGHYTNQVSGEFISKKKTFSKGTTVILTGQKLGRLVPALLEPEAKDGLLKWNYFDRYLVPQWGGGYYPYPVYKVTNEVEFPLENY
jgi:hypothetical protein